MNRKAIVFLVSLKAMVALMRRQNAPNHVGATAYGTDLPAACALPDERG
ncbi:hypothetical protein AB395_00005958 (plasmid) [Sinorhizobium fredii CCBAU 45436]|nr:hypothetical protein AB395_00005958 [Sinorhizobium fredii CCBAU 45436]